MIQANPGLAAALAQPAPIQPAAGQPGAAQPPELTDEEKKAAALKGKKSPSMPVLTDAEKLAKEEAEKAEQQKLLEELLKSKEDLEKGKSREKFGTASPIPVGGLLATLGGAALTAAAWYFSGGLAAAFTFGGLVAGFTGSHLANKARRAAPAMPAPTK
jgi:hypothetical protein